MTLNDMLCSLRQSLLEAIERNDRDSLRQLGITFGVLRESSYQFSNAPLTTILADLEYSALHAAMGVMAKAQDIPSVEAIALAVS